MRISSQFPILLGLSILPLFVTSALTQAADSNDYFCAKHKGVWTTWAKQPTGTSSALVRWKSDKIAGWNPQKRCVTVAQRMQALSDNGIFSHFGGGMVNRQPVLCAVRSPGHACSDRNIILTLPPGSNPSDAIDKILDVTSRARGKVLDLSGSGDDTLMTTVDGQTYVSREVFQKMLEEVETPVNTNQLTPVQ